MQEVAGPFAGISSGLREQVGGWLENARTHTHTARARKKEREGRPARIEKLSNGNTSPPKRKTHRPVPTRPEHARTTKKKKTFSTKISDWM